MGWLWLERPRGSSNTEVVEVRESLVHGKGVFATRDVDQGTVLGTYPGHIRTPKQVGAVPCHAY